MIQLNDVTLKRGQVTVLKNITATIPSGAITAIVGCSGVGKTTLLAALNGLIRPTTGVIAVNGLGALNDFATLQAHRRQTATVFQDHALINRLSVIENVLLGLAEQRHPLSPLPWPEPMQRQSAQALEAVGLLPKATTRVAHLSGGERQRVGVARALTRQPKVLLGDEPFSSIDPLLTRQLGELIRSLVARTGLTVVLVLHQVETALTLADKVIGLVRGEIAFDGPATDFDAAAQARIFSGKAA